MTLTRRQIQALQILAKAERPLRNKDFHERAETDGRRITGLAKALGPCTKPRDHDPMSLWAQGLVSVVEGSSYTITARGCEIVNDMGIDGMSATSEREHRSATGHPATSPVTPGAGPDIPSDESSSPGPRLIGDAELELLSQRARDAVACSYCFMSERIQEWGHVPQRPASRPNDVAYAPWIGRDFQKTPRVAVMMMNPGHKYAAHKIKRMKLGHQLRDGEIGYDEHNRLLTPLVPEWGFGAVVQWLRAIGLEPERIAFLNVALCAVANDKYFPGLFDTCFNRHTRGLLACLAPHVVLLCGKGELEPYQAPIEAMGAKVILTWHYRPMKTVRGKRELKRVRRELDRLGC